MTEAVSAQSMDSPPAGFYPRSSDPTIASMELEIAAGARLVMYQYCISVVILSYKRTSGVKLIRPGQSRVIAGLPYVLLSLTVGWWGIPWGPFWTIKTAYQDLRGGIDVTPSFLNKLGYQ